MEDLSADQAVTVEDACVVFETACKIALQDALQGRFEEAMKAHREIIDSDK